MKYILAIIIFWSAGCSAQNKNIGSLSVNVYDIKDKAPLVAASLTLFNDNIEIKNVKSDFEGRFKIDSLESGAYNLKIEYIGFKPIEIKDVIIKSNEISSLTLGFNQQTIELKEVKVEWNGGYVSFIDSTGNFRCVKSEKKK